MQNPLYCLEYINHGEDANNHILFYSICIV
jgi:hypothetical protein